MDKLSFARMVIRKLAEKRAGLALPFAVGAAAVGGAHMLSKGVQKSKEYKAGFQPGGYGSIQ